MAKSTVVSSAFTFTPAIEKQIVEIATINAGFTIAREDNIVALFALLGYDGTAKNVIGKEWERVQAVYAEAAALVTFCTVEHEKKAFRRLALSLGYGKLQTAEAKALQAERAANKAESADAGEAEGTDEKAVGKATAAILKAIALIDAGDTAAARAILTTMVPAKALKAAA